uniref:AlNc14C598G12218 protein n=1 Tax=Albugo laibachii Nc14 TaxID=890382 RepID=F0X1C6_9STRA|nr:AlNc14C598G12218 [Albugo laibachii Nc14]|eukprot:CCA27603.1 AlNc14C598G12218 [Albugo laibachii Nc14]
MSLYLSSGEAFISSAQLLALAEFLKFAERVCEALRVSQSTDGLVRPRNWNALGQAPLIDFYPVATKVALIVGV